MWVAMYANGGGDLSDRTLDEMIDADGTRAETASWERHGDGIGVWRGSVTLLWVSQDWDDETDYCYVCDRVTTWSKDETCDGCGRTWGYDHS